MTKTRRFKDDVLAAVRKANIIGIRSGTKHRFIAVWAVVVKGRVFMRAWKGGSGSWYFAFVDEPRGAIQVGDRQIKVRAIQTRSERLKDAVTGAYREKYKTPASLKYVRDFARPQRRNKTIEVVPR